MSDSASPHLVKSTIVDDRAAQWGKLVLERHYVLPSGKQCSILCVSNNGFIPVLVCPITRDGALVLIRQFRFGINGWLDEFPGGMCKAGHALEEAARAELREETGFVAESIEIIGEPLPLNAALEDSAVVPMIAHGCSRLSLQELEETELAVVCEMGPAEFRQKVRNRQIVDSKTIALGYLAFEYLDML